MRYHNQFKNAKCGSIRGENGMTILTYAENAWDKIHDPSFTKNIQKWLL